MQNQSNTPKKLSAAAAKILSPFIGSDQTRTLKSLMRGEEGDYFVDMLEALALRVAAMPVTYGQDGLGRQSIAYLHYFVGGCDFYITEKDSGDGTEDDGQHQAFGWVNMGHGAEAGYISLPELFSAHVELDLHWKPVAIDTIDACKN